MIPFYMKFKDSQKLVNDKSQNRHTGNRDNDEREISGDLEMSCILIYNDGYAGCTCTNSLGCIFLFFLTFKKILFISLFIWERA